MYVGVRAPYNNVISVLCPPVILSIFSDKYEDCVLVCRIVFSVRKLSMNNHLQTSLNTSDCCDHVH